MGVVEVRRSAGNLLVGWSYKETLWPGFGRMGGRSWNEFGIKWRCNNILRKMYCCLPSA